MFYRKAGSQFLEQRPPSKTANRDTSLCKARPRSPPTPKPKPASRDPRRCSADGRRSGTEGSGCLPPLLGLRREDTPPVLAKRGGGGPGRVSSDKKPRPYGRRVVHAAGELPEQSTPRGPGWGAGKEEGRSTPARHHRPGIETGGAALLLRGSGRMGSWG